MPWHSKQDFLRKDFPMVKDRDSEIRAWRDRLMQKIRDLESWTAYIAVLSGMSFLGYALAATVSWALSALRVLP